MATVNDAVDVIENANWYEYDWLSRCLKTRREQLLMLSVKDIHVGDTVEVAGKGRGKVLHIDPDYDVHVAMTGKRRKVVIAARYVRKC